MKSPDPGARWTRRRVGQTALHSIVGFLIGLVGAPIFGGFFLAVTLERGSGFGAIAMLAGLVLTFLMVARSMRGSCERHPLAPQGIALGIGVGGAIATVGMSSVIGDPYTGAIAVYLSLVTITASLAAYIAGRRAVVLRLGEIRKGVGLTCAKCVYDLSATPEGWPCPECGSELRYQKSLGGA